MGNLCLESSLLVYTDTETKTGLTLVTIHLAPLVFSGSDHIYTVVFSLELEKIMFLPRLLI